MQKLTKNHFQKEAVLYTPLESSKIQCNTCWHQCVISKGKFGRCRTRRNIDGTLFCMNYGLVSFFSINPIEKKPLFHYFPGSYASTIGSVSCNFSCPWCQNWSISKIYPSEVHFPSFLSPEELVERTEMNSKIDGISISFNEPMDFISRLLTSLETSSRSANSLENSLMKEGNSFFEEYLSSLAHSWYMSLISSLISCIIMENILGSTKDFFSPIAAIISQIKFL